MATALIIGSSDGIGLALARRLLAGQWTVVGVSRSAADVSSERYQHHVMDVRAPGYVEELGRLCAGLGPIDVCVYSAGIGDELDIDDLGRERDVFEVNLMGAVKTFEAVVPGMVAAGRGHFIGLSSQADRFVHGGAPSYGASKAGLSSYLESMALALRPRGVRVTNVRFGFVDTKLGKSDARPFLMSRERAAARLERCIRTQPIRYTRPWRMAWLLWLVGWGHRIRIWLAR